MSIKKDDKTALERYLDKLRLIRDHNQVNPNETKKEKEARIEKAKKDYRFCVKYYFPHYAKSECGDFQIEAAEFIKANKECLDAEVWARAHAKSTHLDIMVPFWLWMNGEIDVMLLVGKNEDDARILLSDLQAEFEANPQILADFGDQKTLGSWEEGNFITKNDVAFFSLGRDQNPRGVRYRNKRPNIIIFDDIDDDQLAENAKRVDRVVTRIFSAYIGTTDDNGCRIIFANNLIHNAGIIAKVIDKLKALQKELKHVRVNFVNATDAKGNPTWKEKYTKDFFIRKQLYMGNYNYQKEYMNDPQTEGKLFKDEQIQWAPLPELKDFECIVGHWDVAYAGTATADFNAVKVWGLYKSNFYLIKAFCRQCKMGEAIKWMIDFEKTLPSGIAITWRFESQFWNEALKMVYNDVLKTENASLALAQCERNITNKFQRIVSQQPYYQNARIYYNIEEKHNYDMQVGINQLKGIEPGYTCHDDSPDADQGAIDFLSKFLPDNNTMPEVGERHEAKGAW